MAWKLVKFLLMKAKRMNEYWGNFWQWRCPYTEEPCESFECDNCEVEQKEFEDMEKMRNE